MLAVVSLVCVRGTLISNDTRTAVACYGADLLRPSHALKADYSLCALEAEWKAERARQDLPAQTSVILLSPRADAQLDMVALRTEHSQASRFLVGEIARSSPTEPRKNNGPRRSLPLWGAARELE